MFSFVSMPSSFFVNAGEANVHNRKKKHAGKSKYKWFLTERFSSGFFFFVVGLLRVCDLAILLLTP